jgi:hypothetical protein
VDVNAVVITLLMEHAGGVSALGPVAPVLPSHRPSHSPSTRRHNPSPRGRLSLSNHSHIEPTNAQRHASKDQATRTGAQVEKTKFVSNDQRDVAACMHLSPHVFALADNVQHRIFPCLTPWSACAARALTATPCAPASVFSDERFAAGQV